MTTIGGEVRFGELVDFSPVDSSSVWEVGVSCDIGTVIRDAKQEVEDECHEDLPPWASDSAVAENTYPMELMPVKSGNKRSFSDILRAVKVREDTLQCAVASLGGGAQGLQVLMEHVNYWALESSDEDVTATIRRGIVGLGMPPAAKRHCHGLGLGAHFYDEGNNDARDSVFDAPWTSPPGTSETVNHDAAYTRALRKSHMVRQRGQTRMQRPQSMSKCGHQSRQWRLSSSHHDVTEPKLCNENGKGYEFLFQKELRASDVSSLGRIVLPKKDAERHLPFLIVREGMMISLEDYHCGKFWAARYRFWPNNKSRMYLLENIGDFVNFHHLQEGDLLLCYRNEQGGYVIRAQKVPPNVKTPAKGLSSKGVQARENAPTTEMKTVTPVMPTTHQFVEGESTCGTHNANLANSSFESLGEVVYGKCFQDGYSRHQQTGYPTCCGGEVSYVPLVHDWGFDPVVAMLSVNDVKQRYMDETQLLE